MGINLDELAVIFLIASAFNLILMFVAIYKDNAGLVCAASLNGIVWAVMAAAIHA